MTSIRGVLFAFGDEARVYPGHGPTTTIGRERRTNPYLVTQ
jgi:hydroxyacylglutathione hydrolase